MPSSSDAADPMVRVDDAQLTLASAAGAVNVLRGVSLRIEAGESVGLVGPSGSGKTSLMMVLGGLERPTAGRVVVAGTELGPLSEDALARFRRAHVGIVFQSFHLVPTMTGLENVAIPLELAGSVDAFERARAALDQVELGHRLRHYPAQLSGGEQQRVAIARAFVTAPKLLLADEPTGNLDSATGRLVIDLLFRLRAEHDTTLLLITHDHDLAQRCDRIVAMADGRIVEDEARAEPPSPPRGEGWGEGEAPCFPGGDQETEPPRHPALRAGLFPGGKGTVEARRRR
jgi:putative ABC transport system ATP-binding protein